MESHVKVLGVLNIVLGSLGTLAALLVLAVLGGVAGFVSLNPARDADAVLAGPIIGIIGTVLFFFLLLLSLPGIIAGIGLLKYKPWARILTIVLSAFNLVNIPIGTALGLYGLWVLLSPGTERLFHRATTGYPQQ